MACNRREAVAAGHRAAPRHSLGCGTNSWTSPIVCFFFVFFAFMDLSCLILLVVFISSWAASLAVVVSCRMCLLLHFVYLHVVVFLLS